ncbi:LacI family DNA-binding transcriptional regulator [Streptomyces iconiensis]|uniref:LacI family DNA-binding transcriptional regulator n=1 Tax=Streptomyces iconiensis TaxID=1384038 RepID=A0ABT6ZWA2_9ACTN|nr:LacI family DNA-binding transcriptional regulator [Streptomyces iconiensis]MDJ1133351.1 LacI family DNA-binding transcriptional regulator [Streptomyces iconiensis]
MAVTLADVAARAGVSAATVSRVLSGNYPVAGATRTRVMRAVEELEYVVNGPASSLAAASSDLVGILVNDIADPFFGIIAGAVQSELNGPDGAQGSHKLAVVCNTGGSPEQELTYLTLLQRQRAAAIVLTGGAVEDAEHSAALSARLQRLAAGGTRIVLCGRPPLGPALPGQRGPQGHGELPVLTVAFDNRGGARRLTEHLLALGHRAIGYVAGPAERTTTRHRLEGHRSALLEHRGGPVREAEPLTVHGGGYDRSSGYDGALELLRREPRLTAVLAANDTVALGVCAALRDQGLRIPEDVSVAGFDDLPFSADAAPALTTVRLPLHEAGARAGKLALGRQGPPPGGVATVRADLMVRDSTARPRTD